MKRHSLHAIVISALYMIACEPQGQAPLLPTEGETGSTQVAGVADIPLAGHASEGGSAGVMSGGAGGGGVVLEDTFQPAPARLVRLTRRELLNTLSVSLGHRPDEERFEVDSPLHGFVRVASAEVTVSPLLAEQLEAVAWELATASTERPLQREGLFGCDPIEQVERGREEAHLCLRAGLFTVGQRLWRRPLEASELDELLALFDRVMTQTESALIGLKACLSALIQSPHTLFRVELGEPHPSPPSNDPSRLRYTSLEMASRLSYLLWGGPPDDELLSVASAGQLTEDDPLRAQAERMIATPLARAQLGLFFDELLGLHRLPLVTKDAERFPELSPELLTDMRQELRLLFERVVIGDHARLDELFTTDLSFVTAPLAQLYGVTLPDSVAPNATSEVRLSGLKRGGLLGRAGLLTLLSHPAQTSPTLRGRFIRSGLLCQDVPPPPEGVVTELPSPSDDSPQTLRMRLNAHVADPLCAGCHQMMDPLGFPLEGFDPIGRARELDNGLPLDLSGELDGRAFDGAEELGAVIAQSERLGRCVTTRLYRYATSHLELPEERPLLNALSTQFNGALDRRLTDLLVELIMSDGFREARLADGAPERGGAGCEDERCDGLDNDCDGLVDERLTQVCEGVCLQSGVAHCVEGGWSECYAPQPPAERCDEVDNDCDGLVDEDLDEREVCNQADDDCDGQVDEDSARQAHLTSYEVLSGYHAGCARAQHRYGGPCNASINRLCQAEGCGGTGFGPGEDSAGQLFAVCVEDDLLRRRQVSYAELEAQHEVCNGRSETAGPSCNAAIHRLCAAEGLSTGFGPLEHSATDASITCVPSAQVIVTSYTTLQGLHPLCQASGERIGPSCQGAIHAYCIANGHRTGWGPVENSGDVAVIACLP